MYDGILVFSYVTPSGKQSCYCSSVLADTRHMKHRRLAFFVFCWWIINWTQITAIHSKIFFNKENVIVVIVHFLLVGCGAILSCTTQLKISSHTPLTYINCSCSISLLGLERDYISSILIILLAYMFLYMSIFSVCSVCYRWYHYLLLAVIRTVMEYTKTGDECSCRQSPTSRHYTWLV